MLYVCASASVALAVAVLAERWAWRSRKPQVREKRRDEWLKRRLDELERETP